MVRRCFPGFHSGMICIVHATSNRNFRGSKKLYTENHKEWEQRCPESKRVSFFFIVVPDQGFVASWRQNINHPPRITNYAKFMLVTSLIVITFVISPRMHDMHYINYSVRMALTDSAYYNPIRNKLSLLPTIAGRTFLCPIFTHQALGTPRHVFSFMTSSGALPTWLGLAATAEIPPH